jgi:hypothetical protein
VVDRTVCPPAERGMVATQAEQPRLTRTSPEGLRSDVRDVGFTAV